MKKGYDEQKSLDLTSEDNSNCRLTLIIKGNGALAFAYIHQVYIIVFVDLVRISCPGIFPADLFFQIYMK